MAAFAVIAAPAVAHPLYLTGTIGKAPVLLWLSNDEGKLFGWYMYLRVGKEIRVEGRLAADGVFALDEFDREKTTQKNGAFAGRVADGRWTGTWRKPDGAGEAAVALGENRATLSDLTANVRCALAKTDKRFGYTYTYAMTLSVANGAVRKLSMTQRATAKTGEDQGCMIGLDDLKQANSDAGLLLQTGDRTEAKTPRCSIRVIGAGDYLFVQVGDVTEQGNDCRFGDEAAYCSPRSFWADMVVDRRTSTCKAVE